MKQNEIGFIILKYLASFLFYFNNKMPENMMNKGLEEFSSFFVDNFVENIKFGNLSVCKYWDAPNLFKTYTH